MSLLCDHHHAIQCGHHTLEFDPGFAALAGGVMTGWVFGDESFVAIFERLFESTVDLCDAIRRGK